MNFYALIIGTEILNGRRIDKHFEFLRQELAKYGHELCSSIVVKDDKNLMRNMYNLVKADKDSILFSFGGIGSTPDDLTRAIAAEIFTNKALKRDEEFEKNIIERFGDEAYPHRIHMADLPQNSKLLFNPVNNMSGFSLENRFFFTPGFPKMSHPMISNVIKKLFSKSIKKYRLTLLAQTSENTLIDLMQKLPKEIELSSLPILKDDSFSVEISLASINEELLKKYFNTFKTFLNEQNITYN